MRKNILYKALIVAVTIFMGACTDLEENPIGLLAPESYFQTEDDVEAAVMGAYSYLASEPIYGRQYTTAVCLLDDVCDIGDIGTQAARININNHAADASNGMITSFWPRFYQAIGAANAAINGLEKITVTDQTRANELMAEARIIRAHCYYSLVQLFGDIPYVGEFVTDPASVADISKTPEAEVYQYIIADCEYAAENLPDKYTNDIRCRPTAGAAKTMLASVYLTRGEYAKAAQYAEEVINNASVYGYELLDDFTEIWIADNGDSKEHIWTVDFLAGITDDLWSPMSGVRNADMQGWSVVVPSPGFYDMYEQGDHRMEVTFILETPVGGVMTPYSQWKWPRIHFGKYSLYPGEKANSEGRYSGRNFPIFRFAEVYLIAAEALAEVNNGPNAKAYEYVNKVRERARFGGTVPADLQSGMSKTDFIEAVLKERMLELPLEYKRWFDIKRRQLGEVAFEGANSLEPHSFDPSKNYLLPLPQDELDRNPNLLPQNPGY
jgi:tetratricopeptide (TPR) repeat protein